MFEGRNARELAQVVTDPNAVSQLLRLRDIAPDSPRAQQIVSQVLMARRAGAPPVIQFDANGNRMSP
jgi:hypothetical protein